MFLLNTVKNRKLAIFNPRIIGFHIKNAVLPKNQNRFNAKLTKNPHYQKFLHYIKT
jgi:hypothetical protein